MEEYGDGDVVILKHRLVVVFLRQFRLRLDMEIVRHSIVINVVANARHKQGEQFKRVQHFQCFRLSEKQQSTPKIKIIRNFHIKNGEGNIGMIFAMQIFKKLRGEEIQNANFLNKKTERYRKTTRDKTEKNNFKTVSPHKYPCRMQCAECMFEVMIGIVSVVVYNAVEDESPHEVRSDAKHLKDAR